MLLNPKRDKGAPEKSFVQAISYHTCAYSVCSAHCLPSSHSPPTTNNLSFGMQTKTSPAPLLSYPPVQPRRLSESKHSTRIYLDTSTIDVLIIKSTESEDGTNIAGSISWTGFGPVGGVERETIV